MLNSARQWLITAFILVSAGCLAGCSQDKSVKKGTDTNLKQIDFNPPVNTAAGKNSNKGIGPGK